jgi:hypothetical protein
VCGSVHSLKTRAGPFLPVFLAAPIPLPSPPLPCQRPSCSCPSLHSSPSSWSSRFRPPLLGSARPLLPAMPFARKALLAFGVAAVFAVAAAAEGGGSVCFDRVFSFGDSLTDTGNFLLSVPEDFPDPARHLPYGQTFFGRPAGRYSDGRNLLDFFGNLPTLSVFSPSFSGVIICSFFVFFRLCRVLHCYLVLLPTV